MFSKEERKAVHTAFWKRFKSFGSRHKNAENKRLNWLKYPTGLKQIYVRLSCDNHQARFAIEVQDKDEGIRELIWDQLQELKKVLADQMPSEGIWDEQALNEAGQPIYRIYWHQENVNMYKKEDEERIFRFFMDLLMGFDRFYVEFKEVLFGLIK